MGSPGPLPMLPFAAGAIPGPAQPFVQITITPHPVPVPPYCSGRIRNWSSIQPATSRSKIPAVVVR